MPLKERLAKVVCLIQRGHDAQAKALESTMPFHRQHHETPTVPDNEDEDYWREGSARIVRPQAHRPSPTGQEPTVRLVWVGISEGPRSPMDSKRARSLMRCDRASNPLLLPSPFILH